MSAFGRLWMRCAALAGGHCSLGAPAPRCRLPFRPPYEWVVVLTSKDSLAPRAVSPRALSSRPPARNRSRPFHRAGKPLRSRAISRLCGWQRRGEVPSEATFSRAFAEFATSALPSRLHEALIQDTHADRLVGHISRDSTAIEAREKPATSDKPAPQPKLSRKRGRPRKGEIRPAPPGPPSPGSNANGV